MVELDEPAQSDAKAIFDRIGQEAVERDLAYNEVMLALLKVLLILATRLKSDAPQPADREWTCGIRCWPSCAN